MAVPTKLISTSQAFQDAKGNVVANGFLMLQLSQNAEVTASGGQVTTQALWLPLDANGKITSTAIWFNDELSPTGTVYYAKLFGSNGMLQIQDFGSWSITGASSDLSTIISTSPGLSFVSPAPSYIVVAFSATPALTGPGGVCPIITFQMTLTGNVTAPVLSGIPKGAIVILKIIEDNVGGRTFAYPSNIKGFQTLDTTPNAINIQAGIFDGTNLYAIGPQTVN